MQGFESHLLVERKGSTASNESEDYTKRIRTPNSLQIAPSQEWLSRNSSRRGSYFQGVVPRFGLGESLPQDIQIRMIEF